MINYKVIIHRLNKTQPLFSGYIPKDEIEVMRMNLLDSKYNWLFFIDSLAVRHIIRIDEILKIEISEELT